MKALFIGIFALAFSLAASAQTTESMTKMSKDKKAEMTSAVNEQDKQITDALMKDKELQEETVDYLMNNEDTKEEVAKIAKQTKGSKKGIMASILKNEQLTAAAIDYVKSNPELLKKAMSVVGM
jgi:hypothetical protein